MEQPERRIEVEHPLAIRCDLHDANALGLDDNGDVVGYLDLSRPGIAIHFDEVDWSRFDGQA